MRKSLVVTALALGFLAASPVRSQGVDAPAGGGSLSVPILWDRVVEAQSARAEQSALGRLFFVMRTESGMDPVFVAATPQGKSIPMSRVLDHSGPVLVAMTIDGRQVGNAWQPIYRDNLQFLLQE